MADDTLTARNRINQRNFRARRQNYIKDLEERLRRYESEGVQATIEIQTAARQVTEQNVKLRALLISRYGMNDHEIETYLSSHGPPVSIHSSLLPVALTATSGSKSSPDANGFLMPNYQNSALASQSAPAASVLSPALGLAALHKASDQLMCSEPPTKKQRRDINTHMSISALTSTEEGRKRQLAASSGPSGNGYYSPSPNHEHHDPDTLSESSNPHTPAESLDPLLRTSASVYGSHSFNGNPENIKELSLDLSLSTSNTSMTNTQPSSMSTTPTGFMASQANSFQSVVDETKPIIKRLAAPGDETACEDAARIIASMRGTNERPEQILMELGCTSSSAQTGAAQSCQVKNLSIFSLMDRA